MTPTEHALSLAAEGIPVFPLHGKVPPKGMHFKERASCDPDAIRVMFEEYPRADGVGIYTGTGLLVVDVDVKPKKDGRKALLALELQGDDLPPTRCHQREGSDGYHLIYRAAESVKQGVDVLGPGLDVRSRGGYVRAYPGDGAPIADAPAWLVERCGKAREKEDIPPVKDTDTEGDIRRAIEYLQTEAPIAIKGGGGDQTTYAVAARVKDWIVDPRKCWDLMLDHWNEQSPPGWSPERLWEKVSHAYKYGTSPPGAASPEADFPPVDTQARIDEPDTQKRIGKLRLKTFAQISIPKKKVWLAQDFLSPYGVAMGYGASGAKKSYLFLHACIRIALGMPLFGRPVVQGATLYVAGEGDQALERRAAAIRQEYELKPDVPFALVTSTVGMKFYGEDRQTDVPELIEKARAFEASAKCKLRLLVVDTLAAVTAGARENDGEDMGSFMAKMQILSAQLECCVLIIHHSGKDEARGSRGWSGIKGALETELHVHDDKVDVTKQRDGKDGYTFGSFALQDVILICDEGTDQAAILVEGQAVERGAPFLAGHERAAYDALIATLKKVGEVVPGSAAPDGAQIVTMREWSDIFARNTKTVKPGAIRNTFDRAVERLVKMKLIGHDGKGRLENQIVWLQRAPASEDFASPRDEALPT